MDYSDVLNEIKNPENETVELKTSFNDLDSIGRTIAAFSTKRGGRIYVGIDKTGVPCGTLCGNEITAKLQAISHNQIHPPAQITTERVSHDSQKDLYIVCITVQKGRGVYTFNKVPYERRGDTNQPLTTEEVFEIQKTVKRLYFDELEACSDERPALVSDIKEEKVIQFIKISSKPTTVPFDIRRFLTNKQLTINGTVKVKNSAILLFGNDPQKFVPQAKIRFFIFPSKTVTENFIKKEFGGDLFEQLERADLEIRGSMNVHSFVTDGLKRTDVPDYPPKVIREALVNAIVHRDYFERNTEVSIKMFSDRIEIINPAGFPFENVTFEEIKATGLSKRRNPLIAEIFTGVGLMERGGRGLTSMENSMKEHGLPLPRFEVGSKTFKVTLFNASENPYVLQKSPFGRVLDFSRFEERQDQLIKHLRMINKPIGRKDYMELFKTNEKTATRDLTDMVRRHLLSREGRKRGTKYVLVYVP